MSFVAAMTGVGSFLARTITQQFSSKRALLSLKPQACTAVAAKLYSIEADYRQAEPKTALGKEKLATMNNIYSRCEWYNDPTKYAVAQICCEIDIEDADMTKKIHETLTIAKRAQAANSVTPIWKNYRRNFPGQFPPTQPRLNCRAGIKVKNWYGNPCPLCRITFAKNPSVTYTDVPLLKQFICPHTNKVLPTTVTNVCRRQQKTLLSAVAKARDYGYLLHTVPRINKDHARGAVKPFKPCGYPTDRKVRLSGATKNLRHKRHDRALNFTGEPYTKTYKRIIF